MRKWFLILGVCVPIIALCAETRRIPDDKPLATIRVPNEWQTKNLGEGFKGESPDGMLHLLVIIAERNKTSESVGEAMRYIRNTGAITVEPESLKRDSQALNGFDLEKLSWSGKDKNGPVIICFTVIAVSKGEPLLVAYWGSPKAETKHRNALDAMLRSIRKFREK